MIRLGNIQWLRLTIHSPAKLSHKEPLPWVIRTGTSRTKDSKEISRAHSRDTIKASKDRRANRASSAISKINSKANARIPEVKAGSKIRAEERSKAEQQFRKTPEEQFLRFSFLVN